MVKKLALGRRGKRQSQAGKLRAIEPERDFPKSYVNKPRVDYTPELMREICDRIGRGETLIHICSEDRMPDVATACGWASNPSLKVPTADGGEETAPLAYGKARLLQISSWADQTIEIADDLARQLDRAPDAVALAKLRIDSRKWLLARLAPDRYGERIDVTSRQDGTLTVTQRRVIDVNVLEPGQRDALRAALLAGKRQETPVIEGESHEHSATVSERRD